MTDHEKFLFECTESICRGDECLACGAEWEGHEIIHADTCSYMKDTSDD